jgi:hypothetical protein
MDDLRICRQIVLAEHESGVSVESIAGTFGISQEAVTEHLRAARCQCEGCCDDPVCPRAEIAMLLTPDCTMEQRVDALARVTASTCAGLSDDELQYFFSRAFELDSGCSFARFSQAYKTASIARERKPRAASVGS